MKHLILLSALVAAVLSVVSAPRLYAAVASSTSYQLERDSINIAGLLSTSTNYEIEDTIGEVATGRGTSTTYLLEAGYQQVSSTTITITAPADVVLLPNIQTTGGQADGNTSWTVMTDNRTGYALSARASTNPAMQSGANSFADYTPAGAVPDYTWSVAAGAKEFGFTPEGYHITSTYKDNGSACNVGSNDTSLQCWNAFATTDKTIASNTVANNPLGTPTTIRFRAEAGSSSGPSVGTYSATITLTAVVN